MSGITKLMIFLWSWSMFLMYTVLWSLDICFTQRSPVHEVGMHIISNRDTHLYPPHNNSSIHLTTKTEFWHSGQITDGMRSCWRTLWDSILSSPTSAPTLLKWPRCQEQHGSSLTLLEPVHDIFVLWFWPKNSSFRLPYQRPSSSANCNRELFKSSNGSASLVDCTQKIFWLGGADFLWLTS